MTYPLPTLHIDTRENERPHPFDSSRTSGTDMLKLFQSHPSKPQCISETLHAGDFCFVGEGPEGPVQVGIERKRLKDMLTSIRLGRFSGEQIPKLIPAYEFVYLVLEGTLTWRTNYYSGILEERVGREWAPVTIGKQTFLGLELDSFLNDIAACTPIRVHRTRDEQDTVCFVLSLMHSFSKPWEKRHHHVAIHTPQKYATVGKASTVKRVSNCLDKIGWEKSGEIESAFKSVAAMVGIPEEHECVCVVCRNARVAARETYPKLDGFGKVLSKRVWDQLHGNYEVGVVE